MKMNQSCALTLSASKAYGPFQSWCASQFYVETLLAEPSPTTGFRPIATTFESQLCSRILDIFLPVLRFLALIAAPVCHPPCLGDISVEAHATAIFLAGALEDVEMYSHHLRPSAHWSWMHCHLHLSVASRYSLDTMLKAFLRTTERCSKDNVERATTLRP